MSAPDKRTPFRVPLPCFGSEYVPTDPECIACPHQTDCRYYHGSRAKRIPLAQAEFKLVPRKYGELYDHLYTDGLLDDPEIPQIQVVYNACYLSVFGKPASTNDQVKPYAAALIQAARRANCTLRVYFLSNMIAHRAHQKIILKHTDLQKPSRFHVKMLVGKIAERRVETYASLCRKEFGTFSATALAVLDKQEDDLEQRLLNSEIIAGYYITDWKILHGGPILPQMYEDKELAFDPAWLSIETTYEELVVKPYLEKRGGSPALQTHRFTAIQMMAQLKKHQQQAAVAFRTREFIMRRATDEVLRLNGCASNDFEIIDEAVVNPMEYWNLIGLALQHFHCLRFYQGEPSALNVQHTVLSPA